MKQVILCGCALLFSVVSSAGPIVSVTSSCPEAICAGGVQAGSVVVQGVQSLDVYASVSDPVGFPIEPTPYSNVPPQPGSLFTTNTMASVYIGGSGVGALVIDPIISSFSTFPGPGANTGTEPGAGWEVDGLASSSPFCESRPFACRNDLQIIPITLGTIVTVEVGEGNKFGNYGLAAGTTQTLDLNLWALDAYGDILPVTLATQNAPEPSCLLVLGLAVLGISQLRRFRAN